MKIDIIAIGVTYFTTVCVLVICCTLQLQNVYNKEIPNLHNNNNIPHQFLWEEKVLSIIE